MNALRRRGQRVAYLEARCHMLERLARIRYTVGTDEGNDRGLYDVGTLILELQDAGRTDAEIVEGVLDLAELRIMTGLDDPVGELAGGEPA